MGGFFITNKLTPTKGVGYRFTEGEILASNEDFFFNDQASNDTIFKSGPLARVAIVHSSSTFEDSTIITDELAERLSTYITHHKDITLGKNSNIYHMTKVGDKIRVGDPLLVFDESYEDEYLNKLLARMNEDIVDELKETGHTPIKSHYNGEIVDVKIYYTVPKNELSESLQKIILDYEKDVKLREKIFANAGVNVKDLTSLGEVTEQTKPINGKVKGVKMGDNQVLIEFYIKVLDKFGQGDKLTYSVALKGINQTLIPKGQEPYLASDPSIKVDALCGLTGVYARMTNSVNISLGVNAIMLAMEKRVKEVYEKHFGTLEMLDK